MVIIRRTNTLRVAAIASMVALAAPTDAASPVHTSTVKDWAFTNYGDGTAEAWTHNDSGSSLGVYCSSKGSCFAYLASDTGCEDNSKYPILINANSGAQSTTGTCRNINDPASKNRAVLVIEDFEAVLNTMLKDHTIGIAIPLASGMFKVTRFSLEGSNEALTAVNQTIGPASSKPAGTKDQVL